jgi:hypothetical protein
MVCKPYLHHLRKKAGWLAPRHAHRPTPSRLTGSAGETGAGLPGRAPIRDHCHQRYTRAIRLAIIEVSLDRNFPVFMDVISLCHRLCGLDAGVGWLMLPPSEER